MTKYTNSNARRHLAARIAATFALSAFAPACFAAYDNVLNCNDTGPGSLRATIASAANGDIVILNPVATHCSVVTLASGEIGVPQDNLTLKYNGNNSNRFLVTAANNSRVLNHTGTGTLKIQRLQIKYGHIQSNDTNAKLYGGCIGSNGTVDLESSIVRNCSISGSARFAAGGGVFADKGLVLNNSQISGNSISNDYTSGPGAVAGAGAYVGAYVQARYSTISGNSLSGMYGSSGPFGTGAFGGSALRIRYTSQPTQTEHCTISGNSGISGAISIHSSGNAEITLSDSTVSGNTTSTFSFSAVRVANGPMAIANSTIAFNDGYSDVLAAYQQYSTAVVGNFILEGSIISNNFAFGFYSTIASDFDGNVLGSNNIVQTTTEFTTLPGDTIRADPLLLPLANNGGPTLTHAFRNGSPAFGRGNNVTNLLNDQRGNGYPNVRWRHRHWCFSTTSARCDFCQRL